MSRRPLSAKDRRALTLGATVAAPILIWSIILVPYTANEEQFESEYAAELDLLTRELKAVEEGSAEAAVIRDLADVLERMAGQLFSATDGTHGLIEYVTHISKRAPIYLEAVAPITAGEFGQPLKLSSVRVTAESDLEGFLTLILHLETGPVLVVLDSLGVQRLDPDAGDEPERLIFTFIATGLTAPKSGDTGSWTQSDLQVATTDD